MAFKYQKIANAMMGAPLGGIKEKEDSNILDNISLIH